jgi:antibiotic biosynthesis monooxygenase (ABM) superfamily enzyme
MERDGLMVTRVVYHKTKAGKEARFLEMMRAVKAAWQKQLPEIGVTLYRSATAERGVYMALVKFRAENLHHFYEWSGTALEREWGKNEAEAFLAEYYSCLEESRQVAVVTEADEPPRVRASMG